MTNGIISILLSLGIVIIGVAIGLGCIWIGSIIDKKTGGKTK